MSADSDHFMGQPAPGQAVDWEPADLPAPEEHDWYADDALASDEPTWETPDLHDPPTRARLRAPRSVMVAGLTPSRLTRF